MQERTARRLFQLSLGALVIGAVFMWGYATRHSGAWPHSLIDQGQTILASLRQYGRIVPTKLMVTAPPDAAAERVAVHQPQAMEPGWYAVMGWSADDTGYRTWLFDHQGELHHTWALDYQALDPDGPLNQSDAPHGLQPLPDRSLVVTFDNGDVMARIAADGSPVWVRQGVFHHQLHRDQEGMVWTWQSEGSPSAHHQSMVRIDPASGETLESIDLLDDVFGHGPEAEMVLELPADYRFRRVDRTPNDPSGLDVFHPNDVEPLPASMAASFPQFEAGDLLISLRNLDLVAVIDRQTHALLWWRHGPWREQHDPDFLPDGRISVYSNNPGRGRSCVIVMDPATGQAHDPFRNTDLRFYSSAMGSHQVLPGGNTLVVVPEQGQVLVAAADGTIVAEFNNPVDGLDGVHAHIANAVWLPSDYFDDAP